MENKHHISFFRFLLATVAFFLSFTAFAQGSFSVKLRLLDEKTSDPVSFATVSLTVKGKDAADKYVLSDVNGNAELTKVKKGTYVLKAELMGYVTYTQEITVEKNLVLGDVKMSEDVEVLDAAKVTDVGNPIVVKKDTIEYTASSFKTSAQPLFRSSQFLWH